MQHRNALNSAQKTSLVDIIGQGFHTVNRCAWVLLIPILLDLFYWLGPRVSIAPLLDRINSFNPPLMEGVQHLWEQLGSQLGTFDLRYALLLNPLRPLVPTVDAPVPPFTPTTLNVSTVFLFLGVVLAVNVVALVCAALYLLPLASKLNDKPWQLDLWRFGRVVVSLLCVVAIVVGIILSSSLLISIVAGLLVSVAEVIAIFAVLSWVGLLLWFLFIVSFSFDAVVIKGVGPLRAMSSSFWVVQRSLLKALGLWLYTWMIITGMGVIWRSISAIGGWPGLMIAIVGSAYITTGMVAAHLAFFRHRLNMTTGPVTSPRPS